MLFENTNILPEEAQAAFPVGSSGFGGLVAPLWHVTSLS